MLTLSYVINAIAWDFRNYAEAIVGLLTKLLVSKNNLKKEMEKSTLTGDAQTGSKCDHRRKQQCTYYYYVIFTDPDVCRKHV